MGQSAEPAIDSAQATGPLLSWWRRARTSFFWMVAIGLALRFGYILIAHTYKFKTLDNNFSFGFEMGRIGRAIATGRGFSDPFDGLTGPTAWEPPLYPYVIAGVFKLAGVYSPASALILLSLNSMFSALTCIPIFLVARRCFSQRVAIGASWMWALLPPVMFWCTRWVWETSLAALLLAVIFWLTLQMEEGTGLMPWIAFGMLWGVAGLTNTSLLSFLPASGLWALYRSWKKGKPTFAGVVLASLFFAATIAPWLVRDYKTFGTFIFIRSNFGAELRLGNGPGADGTWMSYLHPTQNGLAMQLYQQMGEIAYVAERKRQALEFIRADYPRFAGISLKRFIYYWGGRPKPSGLSGVLDNAFFLGTSVLAFWGLGRALRKRQPGAGLFLWLILSYSTTYYFVFPHPRYRHPIEPELAILIVYVISEAEPRKSNLRPIG